MKREQVHFAVEVADRGWVELEVHALDGEEALSRLFAFTVQASSGEGMRVNQLMGAAARIELAGHGGDVRHVHGLVAEASGEWSDASTMRWRLIIRPRAFVATLGRSCRVMHGASSLDAARARLEANLVPHRFEAKDSYPVASYRAQYREDDWSFAARSLEEDGVYFWFDHREEDSILALSDWSPAAPAIDGDSVLAFAPHGIAKGEEIVFDLAREQALVPHRFDVKSFDPARPMLEVRGRHGSDDATALEIYDGAGGGPTDPEICARRARLMRERAECEHASVVGTATSARLVPGKIVTIAGHPELDGRYLVVEASHQVVQRAKHGGAPAPYRCRFRAIAADVPFRPARTVSPARQLGLQTGVVVGPEGAEIHPDAHGRVRVQHHWDRDGRRAAAAGKWMRVAQRATAESMLLPRVGWTVLSYNDEGSIDEPTVLKRVFDSESPPPYTLPDERTRVVYKTATSPGGGSHNEIRFEDRKGAEELFVQASRDLSSLTQNQKTEHVARDVERTIMSDRSLAVGCVARETVARDQFASIGHDERWCTSLDQARQIGGNETVTIASNANLRVGDAHATNVVETRELQVGVALVDAALANIATSSGGDYSMTVGAGAVRHTGANMSEMTGKAALCTVGVARVELAREARAITSKKLYQESIGGDLFLEAGAGYKDSAAESSTVRVAAGLSQEAPELKLLAEKSITLVCGSSVITVEATKVSVLADAIKLDGTVLKAVAPLITHN
jgi:type VI secretion system secreted protein VgrG